VQHRVLLTQIHILQIHLPHETQRAHVAHQRNSQLRTVGTGISIEHSTGWRNRDGCEDNCPRGLGPVVGALVEVERPGRV
jgi:hypothetical protein